VGLLSYEASSMFVAETFIHSSVVYPILVLFCAFVLNILGRGRLDRDNKYLFYTIIWAYTITLLFSLFIPLPAKSTCITLILPAVCLYLPNRILGAGFSRKFFDGTNVLMFSLLLFYYFYNYRNNVFIELENQNNAGYTLLYLSPLLLCMENKYIKYMVLFMTGFALFFSLKRSGIAAYILGLIAYFYATIITTKTHKKRFLYIIIICITLFGVYKFSHTILGDRIELLSNRITQIQDGSGREDIYKTTWGMIRDSHIYSLIVGNGYAAVLRNSPLSSSAHNDYMEFLYDYGIIGLVLLLSFMFRLGRLTINLIRQKSQYAAPAAFAFVVILINSNFSHIFYYEWYLLFISLFMGYLKWSVNQEVISGNKSLTKS
jgi:hypothetical protein